ncbi:tail fiber domain-containing protein [Flavobacterium endoglycinae]|uniref:Tail fiber domain-containing protein n=1 Tax=Flavobacterium endoglycinae TaxID=2816357 RepID=A0ABX7Q971_9FLAO|nr:tail fiber domain-containing protein [Flavobacterium endoglycinae]QSW87166.1 tail fiber domain-containing protein [Flavobacterium endoglycinae]
MKKIILLLIMFQSVFAIAQIKTVVSPYGEKIQVDTSPQWILNGNSNGSIKTIGTNDNFDLPFKTNGVEQMRITNTGNVGIGGQPRTKLDVYGALMVNGGNSFPSTTNVTAIGWNVMRVGLGETDFINYAGTGTGGFSFYSLFGTRAPLLTDRVAFISSNGAYTQLSDKRLKTEVSSLEYGLNEIMKLEPKIYNMHTVNGIQNGKVELGKVTGRNIGLLAQDLYQVIPEAVNVPEDENMALYSISYSELIPVLINAVKEQQSEINGLKDRLQKVENSNK